MIVLITGSSSGIGLELARIFLNKGFEVIGVSRREVSLGERYTHIVADLSRFEGIIKVREALGEKKIDIMINNAGFGIVKPLLQHTWDEIEEIFRVNTISPVVLTKELLGNLKKGSTVVFVISGAAFVKTLDMPAYGASKSALHYLATILSSELKERGIKVLRVYPKQVNTDFWKGNAPRGSLDPKDVAMRIVRAIEEGKEEVFIPWYIGLSKHFPIKYRLYQD
ncbi:SDR family oxidoreductase [Pyrococcus sp. ST04]|uniref:SDR family NAD(P)-dependent oxidoreductase n=1 Tax=Pyrococcus sp. ST04 TaxID=1183377 RepID=UPI0002605E14|nr:SDR family NAD(P)-dependent oxidoreductase [Pyrococcus sp. ST04]AFK23144.1 putative short-chain alcohol dehydrogenase [Pyrococcus sp. ST04]